MEFSITSRFYCERDKVLSSARQPVSHLSAFIAKVIICPCLDFWYNFDALKFFQCHQFKRMIVSTLFFPKKVRFYYPKKSSYETLNPTIVVLFHFILLQIQYKSMYM